MHENQPLRPYFDLGNLQVVQDVPQERCNLIPRKKCSPVTKVIPRLEAETECMNVPKEICEVVPVAAKRVRIPRMKNWCGPEYLVNRGTTTATPASPTTLTPPTTASPTTPCKIAHVMLST